MNIFKKVIYVMMGLSLLPIMGGYFAYGNTRDLIFLAITFLWAIGLFLVAFSGPNKLLIILTFVVGLFVFGDLIRSLDYFYFTKGTDPTVTILFSLQAVFMLVVLFLLLKDSGFLRQATL